MKHCPNCNSQRILRTKDGIRCKNCNYENRPSTQPSVFTKQQRYGSVNINAMPLVDYHNTAYKFKILGQDVNVKFPIEKRMRGWVQQWVHEENVKVLRTPDNVIIYLDRRFSERINDVNDLDALDEKVKAYVLGIAQKLQQQYALVLDLNNCQALRKEIKLVEGIKSPVMFQGDKVKVVYPDGTVEFIGPEAVQSFKNFFNNMAALDKVSELENNIAEFAANWKLHQQVLLDLQKNQADIAAQLARLNSIPTPKGVTNRLKNWVGSLLAYLNTKTTASILSVKLGGKSI